MPKNQLQPVWTGFLAVFFGSVRSVGVLGQPATGCGCRSVQIGLKNRTGPDLRTLEEYEEEITGLRLEEEDLGEKEKVTGNDVYSHIAWADKMATIVKGAKLEMTATYIGHVRKELPKLLREKVGAGHADWEKFLQAVREVDMDHIRDGVNTRKKEQDAWKKEQEEQKALKKRIQQLEKLTASPTAPLRQQMTTFSIGNPAQPPRQVPNNPFMGTAGGQGNLFQTAQARGPAQNSTLRPPPTQADRAALLTCIQKYLHHPNTEAGRQAHQAQQAEWAKHTQWSWSPPPTHFNQEPSQSGQASASHVDSWAIWGAETAAHVGATVPSTPANKHGGLSSV